MATSHPRTRLEQRMHAARLSHRDVLRRFPEEAERLGEGPSSISDRQLKRWLAGDAGTPRAATCRVLEGWFGEPVERLLGPPDAVAAVDVGGDAVAEAGKRSFEHALDAASSVDPSALEQLQAAAHMAAHAYLSTPSLSMLVELVSLRDNVYAQLDRTHKPQQQSDLYLLAGLLCGLLSSVSFDLGHSVVAEEQARAAHTYGSVIDHPSLCAWARALQATVALWSAQPRRAVAITESALATAPTGTARVRLHSVRARALALVGARDEVAAELSSAKGQLDMAGADSFLDSIGGELMFDRSRHALCESSAYVCLNEGERAEQAAMNAIRIFSETAPDRHWGSGAVSAQIDLATARALRGDLAGCEDAVREIFVLPPGERTEAVSQRMVSLGRLVSANRYRDSIEAQRIGENIESFTAASLSRTTSLRAIG